IHAFREELSELRREGVLDFTPDQESRLDSYFEKMLGELASKYDVDVAETGKRLSLGMRIASALGGIALCIALFLFFYRFWGLLTTPPQVVILIGATLAALALTEFAARREKTLYFAGLAALLALASFVLNLYVLGSIFNIA